MDKSHHLPAALREFINRNFLFGAEHSFNDDDSLVENGIIDSIGVMELVEHIESRYGIEVGDDELVPENLDSVSRLARFISAKRAKRDSGARAASG